MSDLHIKIHRMPSARAYRVTIQGPDGRTVHATLDPQVLEYGEPERSSVQLAAYLARSLVTDQAVQLIGETTATTTRLWWGRVLLEIGPLELGTLPWEGILQQPPLQAIPALRLVRFLARPSRFARKPFSLPIDILLADLSDRRQSIYPIDPPQPVLRYFGATIATHATPSHVRRYLTASEFDVVHLRTSAFRQVTGEISLGIEELGSGLNAPELVRLLAKANTRLLVLEGPAAPPLLELGYRLLATAGPAIAVVAHADPASNQAREWINSFYLGIVHDQPLHLAVTPPPQTASGAGIEVCLLHPQEGENVLRLSDQAPRIQATGQRHLQVALQTKADLDALNVRLASFAGAAPLWSTRLLQRRAQLDNWITQLRDTEVLDLNYLRETGAMVPLTKASSVHLRSPEVLALARRYVERVVNTWFSSSDFQPLGTDESLIAAAPHNFHLHIGRRDSRSNVYDPRPIPEEELIHFYSSDGVDLRVLLFSDDFTIPNPEQQLRLPRPPDESEELTFAVTPRRSGKARLRACVYYKHNLLQSVLVRATVTESRERGLKGGNTAEVEFALSTGLRDMERFSERALNILTNKGDDGTHTFAIAGTGLARQFTLLEAAMRTGIDQARSQLQRICSTLDGQGRPKDYRFDGNNRGNENDFVSGVRELAAVGYQLYTAMVIDQGRKFESAIAKVLGQPGRTVQISLTRSANYVFPWAIIYDQPLVIDPGNVLCEQFLLDLRRGGSQGFLENQVCVAQGCPNRQDKNVVCPSGFWGFRHTIEQPLSVPGWDRDQEGREANGSVEDVADVIVYQGAIDLLMAVSEQLAELTNHQSRVKGIPGVMADIQSARANIGASLQRPVVHLVYFYCHGGREGRKVWLGVGKKERLLPTDLNAWQVHWPSVHPLVFVNGCHTVDLTPDDLLSFNRTFAYCEASGVIGTEISVPETLARPFAEQFLNAFARGETVGAILRRQRLGLLEHYNPLGLVYTPYCLAMLHLAPAKAVATN